MFVHWDHASQQGLEISWPLVGGNFALPQGQSVTVEQYHSSAATFDPTAWDARRLRPRGARHAAPPTRCSPPSTTRATRCSTPSCPTSRSSTRRSGATSSREFVDAVRAEGLRVGLYFSLLGLERARLPAVHRSGQALPVRPFPARARAPSSGTATSSTCSGRSPSCSPTTAASTCCGSTADGSGRRRSGTAASSSTSSTRMQPDILVNDRLPGFGDYARPSSSSRPARSSGRGRRA